MLKINSNFLRLHNNYLFAEIVQRTTAFQAAHPEARVLKLGIGDVQGPMAPCVIQAMHRAVEDQTDTRTFYGYGLEHGPLWLRQAIADFDYHRRGIPMQADEVFVSDGAGTDLGNIGDILSTANRVAITDPVYPAYVDTNVMAGREIMLLPCTAEHHFCPQLPDEVPDIIYLCSPNNPTGTALNREQLTMWVNYAREHHALIIFDSAYEIFISHDDVPHSIYEIEGAREVAVEIRSFSKTAGFTGVRCSYTVVPHELKGLDDKGEDVALNPLWLRRQCTKYNGASYISMRGAMAVLTEEGHAEVLQQARAYMDNAALIRETLRDCGLTVYGGEDGPYIWVRVPEGYTSWSFFDALLHECQVVCTPGAGFGQMGEGYVRFSGFGLRDTVVEAMNRIKNAKLFAHVPKK